jgi:hypothetical protein
MSLPNPFASREEQKIEPTAEEMSKIMEAFKDAEFRKMFNEYCEEISDPKNREVLLCRACRLFARSWLMCVCVCMCVCVSIEAGLRRVWRICGKWRERIWCRKT